MASVENVVSAPKAKEKVKMANPTDECFSLVLEAITQFIWLDCCLYLLVLRPSLTKPSVMLYLLNLLVDFQVATSTNTFICLPFFYFSLFPRSNQIGSKQLSGLTGI